MPAINQNIVHQDNFYPQRTGAVRCGAWLGIVNPTMRLKRVNHVDEIAANRARVVVAVEESLDGDNLRLPLRR
jgi:hypothetical protein